MTDANVRRTQWIFLAVMVFSLAQVVWWLYDQSRQSRLILEREMELFRRDEAAAVELLERGMTPEEIEEVFPHLRVFEAAGSATSPPRDVPKVRPELVAELYEERRSHLNQYTWEGGFFLLVLLVSMLVVWQSLRREARLGRWQENFLAAVSHELKSPIASLQLAAETLSLRRLDPEKEDELLGRILADTERLGITVANVIDTHRLDHGLKEGPEAREKSEVDLRAAVAEAVSEIEYRAADAGIELRRDVPSDLRVQADPQALRSVLRNLLDNALKAQTGASAEARDEILAEAGEEPPESGLIEIVAGRRDDSDCRVTLSVRDRGIGFEAGESERIFRKFYRIGDELRRRSPGSGLGLHLCRSLIELDGGTIRAESDGPGRGARFELCWPEPSRLEP